MQPQVPSKSSFHPVDTRDSFWKSHVSLQVARIFASRTYLFSPDTLNLSHTQHSIYYHSISSYSRGPCWCNRVATSNEQVEIAFNIFGMSKSLPFPFPLHTVYGITQRLTLIEIDTHCTSSDLLWSVEYNQIYGVEYNQIIFIHSKSYLPTKTGVAYILPSFSTVIWFG